MVTKFRVLPNALLALVGLYIVQAPLSAQTLWLPGSDPANISRAGTGVAFGRSLEACSLNPALLVTLRDDRVAFLSGGVELQSTQMTLLSNSRVLYSTDRNRSLEGFGAGWRVSPQLSLGFKVDRPFLRHVELPMESSSRFFGSAIDLGTRRAELQASYAVNEAFSLGVSVGMTQVEYASALSLRALVPLVADLPASDVNPADVLLETTARQEGNTLLPSFAVGFRYAISSRWTVGGSFTSGVSGRPKLNASLPTRDFSLYNEMGHSSPPPIHGSEERALTVMNASTVHPGLGDLTLPYRIQIGVRNRYNQFMTWEIDLHYTGFSSMKLPAMPELQTPSGRVSTLDRYSKFRDVLSASGMMELNLNSNWIARTGIAFSPAMRAGDGVEPMMGGASTTAFSVGLSRLLWGGELSVGYQIRLSEDQEAHGIEGSWSVDGLRTTGTQTRVEGMGHIISVGFKKSF